MPAMNSWYEENRVLLTQLSGNATLDDMFAQQRPHLTTRKSSQPLYRLVDMSHLDSFTATVGAERHMLDDGGERLILFSVPDPIVKYLSTALNQLTPNQYDIVMTLDEALALVDSLERDPRSGELSA